MLFDSHCHIQDKAFKKDLQEVLKRCEEANVGVMAVVGDNLENSRKAVALAKKDPRLFAIVGVHPEFAAYYTDDTEKELRLMAKEEKVVAIGEIGLDYHWENDEGTKKIQKLAFRRQIRLAQDLDLPFSIHSRDAGEDTMAILKEEQKGLYKGILHCFSGSLEQAIEYIKMGFYISIAGPVTYPNSKKLVRVVEGVPLEHLLIETDCPYLAPQQRRGKRNEPSYVRFTAEKIAELKGVPVSEVEDATYANACNLFKIINS